MILDNFIQLVYGAVYAITYPIRALPVVELPQGITDSISNVGGYLASLNDILPIDTILNILGIYLAIELALFTYKLIMWVIKRIPTQS